MAMSGDEIAQVTRRHFDLK